jgi:cell fate (sporulation/competence/biofilm development) regulator YlbF (YheA/YmcA/DUF963 family)
MMMESILERARELGRQLGQSDEYRAVERARSRFNEDSDAMTGLKRLQELEREIGSALERGQEPPREKAEEYERLFGELQGSASYQGLVAAQSNFDKILGKVNEEITKGMEAGSRSRIILPS